MTLTDTSLPRASSMGGWLHSAYRQLTPHAPGQRSTMPPSPRDAIPVKAADAAQTSQCSAGDDSGSRPAAEALAWQDWDLLFRAALELLARVAVEKSVPEGLGTRLQAPGTALRECVEALDHLRRSLPIGHSEPQFQALHPAGESTSAAPPSAPSCQS